jgi:hypothetical protein
MRNGETMNAKETEVLKAMADAAVDSTGGDFGCTDEVQVKGLTAKQLGGYMTDLEKKGLVQLCPTTVNMKRLVQYVLTEKGWKTAGPPEYAVR